jgi:CDP-diacylglycerol---glycerol-3-phosphate 3-phosphatidyltransferase
LLNLPNSLTLVRIFFVPILLAVMLSGKFEIEIGPLSLTEETLALAIFLAAAGTDFLDGYLARSRRQVTTLGKLLDPIADKLLISGAFICLVELDRVAAWIVVLVIGREFAVSGLRHVALTQGVTIAASGLGKAKMVAQVVAVSLLLIAPYGGLLRDLADLALAAVVGLTIFSMYDYFRAFWLHIDPAAQRQVEERRSKSGLPVMRKAGKQEAS